MNFEICGSEIKGQPFKTKIDNSEMITCKECSRYGKVQNKPQQNNRRPRNNNRRNNNNRSNQNRAYTRRVAEEDYEIVDNYQKLIRQAREKQGLTQKDFGQKIYERESVIAHIESGKMVPDIKLAQKIEKILRIKLVEKTESDEREFQDARRFREATIGDIARIKRK